jgi:hypothetical protein
MMSAHFSLGSSEHINRRLENVQFLSSAVDRDYFDRLKVDVESLLRPGDNFYIPRPNEPFAWRRLYALYASLKRRDISPGSAPVANAPAAYMVSTEAWDNYVSNICIANSLRQSGRLDPQTCEYIGLLSADLEDPVPRDGPGVEFGRYPDWRARAFRIGTALGKFECLTASERASISSLLAQRRSEQKNAGLAERIAQLEAAATQKQTKEQFEDV